jgi:hypothetical protein
MALDRSLLARAAALRALDDEVTRSARTAEHAALAERYGVEQNELMAPYVAALEEFRLHDATNLELVMTYLETRPEFLGSAYLTSRLIRAIAKLEPEVLDRPRLDAILASIEGEAPSEVQRAAASLARRLAAGSPRRSPRVLVKKERPAVAKKVRPVPEPREAEPEVPHLIPVKGRAI